MIVNVDIKRITDNPYQGRTDYADIAELAASIESLRPQRPDTLGLLQVPVARLVRGNVPFDPSIIGIADALANPEISIQLACGHRRLRAFRLLAESLGDGYHQMPVDIVHLTAAEMAQIAWRENQDRRDPNPIEQARLVQQALATLGLKQTQIAAEWGVTPATISNLLRLLALPEEIQARISDGTLTARHGRALLPLQEIGLDTMVMMRNHVFVDSASNVPVPVATLETLVAATVEQKTARLDKAAFDKDWTPETQMEHLVVGYCRDCPHNVTVLKHARCTNPVCYRMKQTLHLNEVAAPAELRKIYDDPQNVGSWKPATPTWQHCHYCNRSATDLRATHAGRQWYVFRTWAYACPACWERAGLPNLAQVHATGVEVTPTIVYTAPAIPAPASADAATIPAPKPYPDALGDPHWGQPARQPTTPQIPQPSISAALAGKPLVEVFPTADVPTWQTASTPPAADDDTDLPDEDQNTADEQPRPLPAPPLEPELLLTIRVYPGAQLRTRRITASIGNSGQGPSAFRSGTLEEIDAVIANLLYSKFGDALYEATDEELQ